MSLLAIWISYFVTCSDSRRWGGRTVVIGSLLKVHESELGNRGPDERGTQKQDRQTYWPVTVLGSVYTEHSPYMHIWVHVL